MQKRKNNPQGHGIFFGNFFGCYLGARWTYLPKKNYFQECWVKCRTIGIISLTMSQLCYITLSAVKSVITLLHNFVWQNMHHVSDKSNVFSVFFSGGTVVTGTGQNVDSVEEPVMVVTVSTTRGVNTYYQVVIRPLRRRAFLVLMRFCSWGSSAPEKSVSESSTCEVLFRTTNLHTVHVGRTTM